MPAQIVYEFMCEAKKNPEEKIDKLLALALEWYKAELKKLRFDARYAARTPLTNALFPPGMLTPVLFTPAVFTGTCTT